MNCAKKPRRRQAAPIDVGSLDEKLSSCGGVAVAYGGGVDSTAMLIRLVQLGIRIDAILFADTGGELPRTYQFICLFSDWLEARGYPRVTTVRNIATRDSKQGAKKGVFESLEDQLLRLGNLPPVAYGSHTCAAKMKVRPQDLHIEQSEWARASWAQGRKVLKLVGFEAGEGYRAARKSFRDVANGEKYEIHFPLIEWGWDRAACEAVIAQAGLPSPGKSACFFCPMRKEEEIVDLEREHPELYARALALEARALDSGRVTTIKGLGGRKRAWRDRCAGRAIA